jgi:hypothetical protein
MVKPRDEVSRGRFLPAEAEMGAKKRGLCAVWERKPGLVGVFMADLPKRMDDFLGGHVRGALDEKWKLWSGSSFSLSSMVMERSNSELVGVVGMSGHTDDGGRAYWEGVRAGGR